MDRDPLQQGPEGPFVLVVEAGQHLVLGRAQPRAGRQAQVVAANIRALITGDGELARYDPPAASIIVPVGPDGGAGQRADSADLVPAEVVAQLKGRDMMVDRFAELLGVKTADRS